MNKKANAIITFLVLTGIIFGLSLADIFTPDRLFSEYENRLLASKPELNIKVLVDGTYMEDYETYITDQFVARNTWISIKTSTDVLISKKEINGVYLAKDGTLIEKHIPEEIKEETVAKRLKLLKGLVEWQTERGGGTLRIMLIPTGDNMQAYKLPDYAPYYLQKDFLLRVRKEIGDEYVINVENVLNAHNIEYLYYGTDHHWTTLGAYYGYTAWAENMKMTKVSYNSEVVSSDFYGTLHSKTNLRVKPDYIEKYIPPITENLQVFYDFENEGTNTLYEEKYLNTKNKYGYFLDDNHPFIRIETGSQAPEAKGKRLFVIKDSYANCFIPFLTSHYETIYVLDLRYYRAGLFSLLEEYDMQGDMDVLVLYNVIHFIDEFQYY